MGQHYIPKYYLKGFTDLQKPSNIWVYEKGSTRIFSTTIEKVAIENNRWPKDTEEYLANVIEDPANPVLEKIRNCQAITQDDKDVLSAYIVLMLKRVPKGLERMKEIAPEVADEVFENVESSIQRLLVKYPEKRSILEAHLQKLPDYKLEYEKEFPMEVYYNNLTPNSTPGILDVLRSMKWTFLISNGQPFLASDNPVFYFESLGLGNSTSELSFPISSDITLLTTWRKNILEGYVAIKENILREINRRTASIATKYIYYSQKVQWVVNLVNKKNPRLNRLV